MLDKLSWGECGTRSKSGEENLSHVILLQSVGIIHLLDSEFDDDDNDNDNSLTLVPNVVEAVDHHSVVGYEHFSTRCRHSRLSEEEYGV